MAYITFSSALREDTTFLYAEEQRFLSAGVNYSSLCNIQSAQVSISQYLSVCCASFAKSTQSSFLKSLPFIFCIVLITKESRLIHVIFITIISQIICYKIMNLAQTDKTVYQVTIQLNIVSATTAVRFPCLFSVQWKTNNQKVSIETAKFSPQGSKTDFNQNLVMKTEIGFDKIKKSFVKKETQVQLNLTSKNRADQSKLVGRVTIDLASIVNENLYSQPSEFPLQFCSVNASIMMSFRTLQKIQTDLSISELEQSYGDSLSLNSALKLVGKQKNKESIQLPSESSSPNKNKIDFLQILKKQLIPSLSPQPVDPITIDAPSLKQSLTTINELRNTVQQKIAEIKPSTRSFKNSNSAKESILSKKSEITEDFQVKAQQKKSAFKKLGSMNSDASDSVKFSEDLTKQKIDNERLKQQSDKHRYEGEQHKIQLQKMKQQYQILKLQVKQKKNNSDQATNEVNIYKNELAKMRDQVSKSREQCVSLSLKLASLNVSYNNLLVKSSESQRQLTKLQTVNEKNQLLHEENEGLLKRLNQFQAENIDLKNTLNNLDQMHQQALLKCNQHQEALVQHQDSFGMLREKLTIEIKQKLNCKMQAEKLQEQVKKIQQMIGQYEETNNRLLRNSQIQQEQLISNRERIQQLEQGMIELDNQIQFLNEQNNRATQIYNDLKEQYQTAKAQRTVFQQQTNNTIKQQQEQILGLKNDIDNNQSQKKTIEGELSNLHQALINLQKDYDQLKAHYDSLKNEQAIIKKEKQAQSNNLLQLQASFQELANKNNEMEELVLNINQLRERQREQFTNKQRSLMLTISEHQSINKQLTSMLENSSEKITLIEDELKGRQNLIVRLQQGLNMQVQRSEELSKRVMHFMDKEERLKQTILLVEIECKKVNELLIQQQLKQTQNIETIHQQQRKIQQITTAYQQSIKHIEQLQEQQKAKENSFISKINSLSNQIQNKNRQSFQLQNKINDKASQIIVKSQKLTQIESKLSQQIQINSNLINQLNSIQNEKSRTQGLLIIKQSAIQSLQNEVSQKFKELQLLQSSIQNQAIELNQFCQKMSQKQAKHEQEMKEMQGQYQQLSNKYQEGEHERVIRQQHHLQSINALQLQISQLRLNCQALNKQIKQFNINQCKDQIKKKAQEIRRLQNLLKNANQEINKIPTLERALKIKSIELSSLKFKGKTDGSEENELIRLKDQQISSLRSERDAMIEKQRELQDLKQKNEALAIELELLEQQKFNMESLSNERTLQWQQAREQNKKLMDQITIIGQRNGQLQKSLQDLLIQNLHSKSTQNIYQESSPQMSNLLFICKSLLQIIDVRNKNQSIQKIYELIQNFASKSEETNANQKIKSLSREFQKIKVLILKNDPKQRARLITLFREYQGLLSDSIQYIQI